MAYKAIKKECERCGNPIRPNPSRKTWKCPWCGFENIMSPKQGGKEKKDES